jgi:tRNA A58 N-methylase Trm61
MAASLSSFLELLQSATHKKELVKLTLGNKRNKNAELKNVFIKNVALKTGDKLCFVYRYPTNDITKNFDSAQGIEAVEKMLREDFLNADLFTANNDFHLLQSATGAVKIQTKPASHAAKAGPQQHDKVKNRIVKANHNIYLQQLGITTADGLVKKDMQDKYKQINRYVEIIDGIVKDLEFSKGIHVTDMGSGKGYLTFALYDYLSNILQLKTTITGIEMRPDLVNTCNQVALKATFHRLHFEKGTIADAVLPATDMLIALHACDTATDDAIFKGIQANAKVIICAPCCHKQIRRQMKPANVLSTITKHGILLERQAEIVTDSIRALLLEASGYKTRVFDFIATEHTPKNVMIVGIKNENGSNQKKECLEQVQALKALFGIEQHYLEKLLHTNFTTANP